MTDPVDPLRALRPQRRSGRDRRAPTDPAGDPANLPVVVEGEESVVAAAKTPPADPPAAFAAQLLGQPGQKRGLRGGPPVLDAARAAYAKTEYSGPNDRRPRAGRTARKEI